MRVRLHHLRSALRSTFHVQGVLCAPLLVGLGALVHATGKRHDESHLTLLATFVWAGALALVAAVAMSTTQQFASWRGGAAPDRSGGRLAHPTLPLSPRWRSFLSAISWLPTCLLAVGAWAAVQGACAGYADGTHFASSLAAGPSASDLLPASLLIWPALFVFGFDRRVTHLRLLRSVAPMAAALTAAGAVGAMDSLEGLAATSAILSLLALTMGDKLAALSLMDRPSRTGGRIELMRLPPRTAAAALRRQVIRGVGRALRRALPWIAIPTAAVLAAFHWLYVTAPKEAGQLPPEHHFLLPIIGAGLALWIGAAAFAPVGTRLSAVTDRTTVSAWCGPWARQWALLPVTRRQVFHATYWPTLCATALALFFFIGWHFLVPTYSLSVHSHPWVLPTGLAYCGALTALNCAGLLGHQRLFRVSGLLAFASLMLLCFGVLLDTTPLLALSGASAAALALFIPPWLVATSDRPLLEGA
jgi:hypothetical protein